MRLPLAIPNDSRDTDRTQDTWAVNCFVEKDDALRLIKRPGLVDTIDVVGTGTVGQGIFIWPSSTGPKVISLWDDTLFQYSYTAGVYTLEFGWDFDLSGSGSSLAYNSGTSYSTGDRVIQDYGSIVPDGEVPNDKVLWYCVTAVTGVTPAHTATAYPYWSRYSTKPVGSHPTMYRTGTSVQNPSSPGPNDAYTISTTLIFYGNANAYNATYSGQVSHNQGPFIVGDVTNVYSNYWTGVNFLMNGYDEYPSTTHTTSSDVAYVAANDYSRSHLGV